MYKYLAVLSGLVAAVGCGEDETPASAEACVASGGGGCFVLPTAAVAAADPQGAPATLALGCAAFQVTASTSPINLSGKTNDFFSSAAVGNVKVEGFSDRGMTSVIADMTSDGVGDIAMIVNAMPSELFARTSGPGRLLTHVVGTRWNVAMTTHAGLGFQTTTKATITSAIELVGDSFRDGHGQVATAIMDCDDNRVVNVVGNISPRSGVRAFVDDVRSYYAITGTVPALARRTQFSATTTSGGVAFINVPAGTFYLQAWGFVSEADIAKGASGLTLLGETELIVPPAEVALIAPIFARI